MTCIQYNTHQEFKNSVIEDLFENELEHSFIIGPINKFSSVSDDFVMLSVVDPEIVSLSGKPKALIVAFRPVKEIPLLITSTTPNCDKYSKIMIDFMVKEKLLNKITKFSGPSLLMRNRCDCINSFGKNAKLAVSMTHYFLQEMEEKVMKDIKQEIAEGGAKFETITLDDQWVVDWGVQFYADVGEGNAGRDYIESWQKKMIVNGDMWKWMIRKDDSFIPVAMTAKHRETPLTASIASVYTPAELRGRGYATRCVACVCQHLLTVRGKKWVTLFADTHNPISNRIYLKLGFKHFQDIDQYRFDEQND